MSTDILIQAMNTAHTVSFNYDGKLRVVEVHAVGHSTKAPHNVIMRGYQVAGEASRPLPVWGLFEAQKMDALTIAALPLSEAPRSGYRAGDKMMRQIIAELPESRSETA